VSGNFATYEIEEEVKGQGYSFVAGVDEVGRGAGVSNVVAAAVIIPEEYLPKLMGRVKDSKKLSERKREALYEEIIQNCEYGIGKIDNNVIDEINILEATKLAMRDALLCLKNVDYALVDGTVKLHDLWVPQQQVIRGDSKSISIAAASIIAKVIRDEEMRTLHWIWPQYGWIRNKGYLTKEHLTALKEYGPCKYHRMSFRRVGR
jgi:ribonuclease HII